MKASTNNISTVELRIAGILLSLGALTTIICILLEVNAGWASLSVEMKRTDLEAGKFLFANWQEMQSIWGWSLFGNVFLAIAALIICKGNKNIGWFPASVFWSLYFISSLLLIISFAMSVGSYYNALKVIEEQPALFMVIRGAPLYLFKLGASFGLVICIIYFFEAFNRQGLVSRIWGIISLLILIMAAVSIAIGMVSFTVFALACFLVPLSLGIFYIKNTFNTNKTY